MSKFIEKLERIYKGEHAPMGFGFRASSVPKLKMQLIAFLSQENAENAALLEGADAGILEVSKPAECKEAIQKITGTLPDTPVGARVPGSVRTGLKQLAGACDFLVFTAEAPLKLAENEEKDRILEVEPSMAEGLLRTLNRLPVAAILLATADKKGDFTWNDLMVFHRFSSALTKPLLISAQAKLSGADLLALWEAGVSGIVVEAGTDAEQIKKLRQEIDKTDFPSQPRREKQSAVLPRTGRETTSGKVEEDDEEEDY